MTRKGLGSELKRPRPRHPNTARATLLNEEQLSRHFQQHFQRRSQHFGGAPSIDFTVSMSRRSNRGRNSPLSSSVTAALTSDSDDDVCGTRTPDWTMASEQSTAVDSYNARHSIISRSASFRTERTHSNSLVKARRERSYAVFLAILSVGLYLLHMIKEPFHGNYNNSNSWSSSSHRSPAASRLSMSVIQPEDFASSAQLKNNKADDGGLKIIWLMSFPNSGTSYTVRLLRFLTMEYSASNYGEEYGHVVADSVPALPSQPQGPFWMDEPSGVEKGFTYPTKHVLTKTHCGARCAACPPLMYAESTYSFQRRCFEGRRYYNEKGELKKKVDVYGPENVKKAIHLFRNPFDNVVSRYHHQWRYGPLVDQTTKHEGMPTREEFREHCIRMNDWRAGPERVSILFTDEILDLMAKVPCRAEFFRYIEWHNLAFVTSRDLGIPTMVLYYDWFETKFDDAAATLLEFLEVERKGHELELVPGKFYTDYFLPEEQAAVHQLFRLIASRETWKYTQRFFTDEDGKASYSAAQ
jgi:hypothetical protein